MIRGYLGEFGSGKTLNMVWDLIEAMSKGRHVISNTPIKILWDPPFKKKKWLEAEFIPQGDLFQKAVAYREHCIFAIDEAEVYLPNIFWNKMPPELIVKFHQQRKYATHIWYTAQMFGHSVKRLRDLTHIIYACRKRTYSPRIRLGKFVIPPLELYGVKKFHPAYFHGEPSIKKYKRFYRGSRTLYPSQVRRVYRAFDTNYVVDFSAMMTVKGFMQPTKEDLHALIEKQAIIEGEPTEAGEALRQTSE